MNSDDFLKDFNLEDIDNNDSTNSDTIKEDINNLFNNIDNNENFDMEEIEDDNDVVEEDNNVKGNSEDEARSFLDNFSNNDDKVVEFDDNAGWDSIKEDVIIDDKTKTIPWNIIIRIFLFIIVSIVIFMSVFFVSNYRIINYNIKDAEYYKSGYSIIDRNYIISDQDYDTGDTILFSETYDPNNIVNVFTKGKVIEKSNKVVKILNEDTNKEEKISYEFIVYVLK